jgi:hypothetical protein
MRTVWPDGATASLWLTASGYLAGGRKSAVSSSRMTAALESDVVRTNGHDFTDLTTGRAQRRRAEPGFSELTTTDDSPE